MTKRINNGSMPTSTGNWKQAGMNWNQEGIFRKGVEITAGVNAINLKPTGVPKDSIDLISLMFPETGNFGFVITPAFNYYRTKEPDNQNIFTLGAEASVALRQNKVTGLVTYDTSGQATGTEIINFSVLNYNVMPVRFTYRYQPSNDFHAETSMGIYYNYFNIPNEDAKSFNKLFPEDKPMFIDPDYSGIHSVGFKFTISLNGFMFYADLRNNFTAQSNLADENPFKGFVFNAGFATQLEIFSR